MGKAVYLVCPPLLPGQAKTDMNDLLQEEGEEAVYRVLRGMARVGL